MTKVTILQVEIFPKYQFLSCELATMDFDYKIRFFVK